MAIKVKSKKTEDTALIKQYEVVEGEVVETKTDSEIEKQLKEELYQPTLKNYKPSEEIELLTDIANLQNQMVLKKQAIEVIKKNFVEGRHFIQPTEAMSPFLTQEGASLIASAIGYTFTHEKVSETLTEDFYMCEYKTVGKWASGKQASTYTGSANSKEADMRKVYEECGKDGVWRKKQGKSVYDTIHNIQAKAKKRSMVTLIRVDIGLTGEFGEEYDNPVGNKTSQMKVYNRLYKYALEIAPEAPKKKKSGKGIKTFTEKERLDWQKEWIRSVIFQPNILKAGYQTSNWGTKDIEEIIKLIPKWVDEYVLSTKKQ